jgi:hypothetical protein
MDDSPPQGYLALLEILTESQLFEQVEFGTPAEVITSQDYPLAWLRPRGFESDDTTDPVRLLTVEQFEIEVRVRMEEGQGGLQTFAKLHQLVEQTRAAIDQEELGTAIPGLTLIRAGKYHELYPTSAAILTGSFTRLDAPPS